MDLRLVYHSLSDSQEFFARLIKDRQIRNIAIVIANREGIIKDINMGCIQILGIEQKNIQQFDIKLDQLFPDLVNNLQDYQTVSGSFMEYCQPKITDDRVDYPKNFEGKEVVNLRVQVSPFHINLDGYREVGSILKAEIMQRKAERKRPINTASNYMLTQTQMPQKKSMKQLQTNQGLFQSNSSRLNTSTTQNNLRMFRFVLNVFDNELIYNGEVLDGEQYEIMEQLDASNQLDQSLQNMMANFQMGQTVFMQTTRRGKEGGNMDTILEKQEDLNLKKDWGEGIKIVRYFNGQFQEVDKEEEESDSEEEKERLDELKQQQNRNKYGETKDDLWNIQTAGQILSKDLNILLTKHEESRSVKYLRLFSIGIFILIVGTCLGDYLLKQNEISGQKDDLRQVSISSRQISQMQTMMSTIRELTMLNLEVRIPQYTNVTGTQATDATDEGKLRQMLKQATDEFQNLSIQLGENQKLSPADVKIFFSLQQYQTYDYDYSTRQMISRSYSIADLDLDQITQLNSDVFFVIYNGLNDFCRVLLRRYQEVNDLTVSNLDKLDGISETFLWVSLVCMGILSTILCVLLFQSLIDKRKLMQIFLQIPEKTAKGMNQKCISFLANMLAGEDEELISEGDLKELQQQQNNDNSEASLTGVKRKKFKNVDFGIFNQVLKALMAFILIEVYFVVNYMIGKTQIFDMSETLREFNYTCIAESYYAFVFNAQLALAIDDSWTILEEDAIQFLPQMITQMYAIDSAIHEEHAKNTKQHETTVGYLTAFDDIFFQNTCDILTSIKAASINECGEFANSVVKQGMVTVVVRYFQLLRYTRDRMTWITTNPGIPYDFASLGVTPVTFSSNVTRNNILNIVRLDEIYEMMEIQLRYSKYSFRYLQDIFTEEMDLAFDQYMVQRVLFMVIFLTSLTFGFIMCWIPSLNNLDQDIWSQKSLLTFVPVEDMARIQYISTFIREQLLPGRL